MKKYIAIMAALLVCGVAFSAVQETVTVREVRNPRVLAEILTANFGEIAAGLGIAGITTPIDFTLYNPNSGEAVNLNMDVNARLTAGDKNRWHVPSGGGMLYQNDVTLQNTYATKLTIAKDGKLTMVGGAILDNTTSATKLAITEDAVEVSGTFKSVGNLTVGSDKLTVAASSGNTVAAGTLQVDGAITSGKTGSNGGLTVKSTGAGATTFSVAGATGNTVIGGTLALTGMGNLTGGIAAGADNDKFTVAAASGNTVAAGTVKSTGDFTVGADKVVVTASSGNLASDGTLQGAKLQAGKSDVAGTIDLYPDGASLGYTRFQMADNAGNTATTIQFAEQAAARTYTIPDAGGAASFVMTAGNQTVAGNKTLSGTTTVTGATALNGGLTMDTDRVVIADTTGNTVIKGTFGAAGTDGDGIAVDADGDLSVKRDAAVTRNVTIGGTLDVTGQAKAGTLAIGSGVMARVGDALVWIEGGVTNNIVADVTSSD